MTVRYFYLALFIYKTGYLFKLIWKYLLLFRFIWDDGYLFQLEIFIFRLVY